MSLTMEKAAQALAESAQVIRAVTAERDELRDKLATINRQREAEKVAHQMIDKGVSNEPIDQLTKSLEQMAEQGKLAGVRDALSYIGPDMGSKFASVDSRSDATTTVGSTDLERYLSGLIG